MQRRALLAAAALACAAPLVHAQGYPSRAVRIIVPQPPGGGFDTVGRLLADRYGKLTGQSFVVENRTGSGTLVGTDYAAKAAPDGYTLLVGSVSNLALNPGLYANLPYDSLKDFEPIGLLVSYSYTLVGRKDLPLRSRPEVLAYAKANPGKLNYASAGNGSGQHVLAAALWHLAKVDVAHVPYRGAQPAYQDLLGGRVDLFFDLSPTARVQVDAGNAKALAVSGAARNAMHPQVPTVQETGAAPLELESWFGLFAPAKTPPEVLQKLRADFAKLAALPDVRETLAKTGGKPLALIGDDARALVKRDVDHWSKLVRTLAIRAE
ncbi:tripartite tricarboxylate transporter substrate binding protein [Ramlibacter sp. USB13]|uniref:Tripartite tricarboxylate transporter substrate binding protein n=1 Tax=Ramlibacter cellulosilyticus TaxID=2764187 RepID=A0A923MT01_9BURK|nr:tripartite tricarboxylate transporter substrate binding protein [Ramlibacter cellulosilyticus]MBC5785267.1 tripartite tricarboxylate transporter substrate binding protein [Ramlibacter cellulosilyticus]